LFSIFLDKFLFSFSKLSTSLLDLTNEALTLSNLSICISFAQYEQTLRTKDIQIDKLESINASLVQSSREVESLENENKNLSRKIENNNSEIKYYGRQINQLKEENQLLLSSINLLKTNNTQLESQNEVLLKELVKLRKEIKMQK